MHARALLFTPSNKLSRHTNTEGECVCLCVVVLLTSPPHQYMLTLKMYATRIRLQKHSRRCDAAHDGGFELQITFFGALHRRAAPENLTWSHKARKYFDGPQSPGPQGECVVLNTLMYEKHGYQAAPLLGPSVLGSSFLWRESAHRPFWVAKNKRFGTHRTNGGVPRRGRR